MTESDEDLLGEYLLQWEDLLAAGQDTPASELCSEHPHLVDELARRIRVLRRTAWIDEQLLDASVEYVNETSKSCPRILNERYRLDKVIAEGGFAQVWRGYDLELHRIIAVKLPKPFAVQSQDSFMAEARRVARLKHRGIVPVYDVGREGEDCFIVSEFMEGGSLGDHLVKTPPSQKQAIRWIIEIAEALEFAHLNGVIHRDVKPANILIDNHNRALLADFGIAHSAHKTGTFAPSIGTLRYMAPEQLEGTAVDPRSDIYSLGIVLHEVLTGRLPYSSDDPNILRKEITLGQASENTVQLPPDLRRICLKAIQYDPASRYSSAVQLSADLRRVISKTLSWRVIVIAVTVVVILAFVAGWLLRSYKSSPHNSPSKVPASLSEFPITEKEKLLRIEEARTLGSLSMQRKNYSDAIEKYSRLVELDPSSADAYHRRGVAFFNNQNYVQSLADFSKAISLDGANPEIYQHRATNYTALRQYDDAIADIEQAINLKPANATPYFDLAAMFYSNRSLERIKSNRLSEALKDANRAIEITPNSGIGYFQRATCHYLLKDFERAAQDFTVVIERDPTNAASYTYRGVCFRALGKAGEAASDFEKAAAIEQK